MRFLILFLACSSAPAQQLQYATFFGGEFAEQANGVALDPQGNIYIVGQTKDLVAAPGSLYLRGSAEDLFVLKLDPTLSQVLYFAVFGGSGRERGSAIAVDVQGAAYITGLTFSEDFPTTPGALQRGFGGGTRDAFISKLSPDGSRLEYSTYFGGASFEDGNAIRVDSAGAAYLAGTTGSRNFAATPGAFQTAIPATAERAAFLVKLSPDAASVVFATLLSGGDREHALAVTLDDAGRPWIGGYSSSPTFPVTPNAFQLKPKGSGDAFIARFSADGARIEAATLLGGAICERPLGGVFCDQVRSIHIDGARVIVGGSTLAPDFPLAGAYLEDTFGNGIAFGDGFLAILSPDLSKLQWSTYLGGSQEDQVNAVATNPSGDIFAAGTTASPDFPLTPNGAPLAARGRDEGFLVQVEPTAGKLLYAGLLGGAEGDSGYALATDHRTIVIAGETASRSFPATPDVVQPALVRVRSEGGDAYIAKFDFEATPRLSEGGIVNAASFRSAAIAPGEIISVFGRALGPDEPASLTLGPDGRVVSSLAGVRLLVNDVPAPLTYVSASQLNAVVPYSTAAQTTARIVIEYDGALSEAVAVPAVATAPALFTRSGLGIGPALAVNPDSSPNTPSNPVKRGAVIVLYGTGEGVLEPAAVDGAVSSAPLPKPVADISVRIGNADAAVEYAGAAPGLISGVIQINARVPVSIPGGPETPVSFTAGQISSPVGVTISVD